MLFRSIELNEFLEYEPRYGSLPEGMAVRIYEPGVRHTLSDGQNATGGPMPWEEGDQYLRKIDVYRECERKKSHLAPKQGTLSEYQWPAVAKRTTALLSSKEEMGFFGNIWVRSHYYEKAGDYHEGREHQFDHVSFLTQGKASVQVGDRETIFTAPAWITIKADQKHKITALEDKTVWWCVFALRDVDGSPLEIFDPAKHSPYGHDAES